MRRFPTSPITALIDDEPPRYKLGESYGREITVGELFDADEFAELSRAPLGYGTSAGAPDLRELIAARSGVSAGEVLVTPGAVSALFLLALLLGDPSGEVVVLRPCFPPMLDALRGAGARIVTVPGRFEDGYRLDLERIRDALSAKTQLVMLASPQNPSGVTIGHDVLEQLLTIMGSVCPNAFLLVDEIYREAVHGDTPVPSSFAAASPKVITCSSLSKAHGAPGLRIGWLTVHDTDMYEQLRLAKFNTAISCGALDELLAVRLLQRIDTILDPRRAFLGAGVALVADWVAAHHDELRWVRPDAGAFCCVQLHPDAVPPERLDRFRAQLRDRRTLVAYGEWFGDEPNVFRLGFGYEPLDTLHAGLETISEALRESSAVTATSTAPR